jgi:hypothetical protein
LSNLRTRFSGKPVWALLGVLSAASCQQFLGLDEYEVVYGTAGAGGTMSGGSAGKASGGDGGDGPGGTTGTGGTAGSSAGTGTDGGSAGSGGGAGAGGSDGGSAGADGGSSGAGGSGGNAGASGGGAGGSSGDGGTSGSAGSAGSGGTSGAGGTSGSGGTSGAGGSAGGGCTELLINGDFDAGDVNWTYTSDQGFLYAIYNQASAVPAHTPSYLAWLGGWEGPPYQNEISRLRQNVTIPNNASLLTLSGYVLISSMDSTVTVYDRLYMRLMNGSTAVASFTNAAASGPAFTNVDYVPTWTRFEFSTSAVSFRGLTRTFELSSESDPYDVTNFFVDTLSLCATP